MPLITKYQVYLLIESVVINDETSDSVPDSREEVHCDLLSQVDAEDTAYDIVYFTQDLIQSAKNLAERISTGE